MSNSANKAIVEKMWQALGAMDWEGMKACMHPDIHYQDVPSDDPGAHGPENCVHEVKDGLVYRWSDYWDMQKFVGQFPEWFLEEMMKSTAADFTD